MLASRAAVIPERVFMLYGGRRSPTPRPSRMWNGTAAMLAARGVRAGDRIGVMSLNHPSTVFVLLALARLGATMVPVNPGLRRGGSALCAHATRR